MDKFLQEHVNIPKWFLFVAFLVLVLGISVFLYFGFEEKNAKALSLLSGLISGLILYILSFITGLYSVREIGRFKKMRIKNLLKNRHDKSYYKPIFASSESHVEVMGASCTRLISDFLDENSDDKVLIDAMRAHSNLKVRLLIPQQRYMTSSAKVNWKNFSEKATNLQKQFSGQFEIRRFSHAARHSFVIVDNEMIAGPIFEGQDSKYAPAVHVHIKTEFAQKYLKYFEGIWDDEKTSAI